jgi:hypothetical protein
MQGKPANSVTNTCPHCNPESLAHISPDGGSNSKADQHANRGADNSTTFYPKAVLQANPHTDRAPNSNADPHTDRSAYIDTHSVPHTISNSVPNEVSNTISDRLPDRISFSLSNPLPDPLPDSDTHRSALTYSHELANLRTVTHSDTVPNHQATLSVSQPHTD